MPQAELRKVTHEFVAAAQEVEGKKAAIAIHPEVGTSFFGEPRVAADNVYITLADPAGREAVEEALDDVARRHGLSRGAVSSSEGVLRMDYEFHGRRTHTIRLITPVAAGGSAGNRASTSSARLAIILDDLGYDQASADAVLKIPFRLTVSVIPGLPRSTEVAEEAQSRGDEVILHLPMESESDTAPAEPVELRVGMPLDQVNQILESMLESVPGAAGVNNHEGSRATADRGLMQELMPALRRRGLFFVDSRTTAKTVAYDVARQDGVLAASRNVFLDDTPSREAILSQLDLAAREARKKGSAIAIGHPHPATIAALEEGLPRIHAQGIELVFVSSLVH